MACGTCYKQLPHGRHPARTSPPKYGVTRADQDAFALASQQKTEAAQKAGKFKDEILPLEIPQRKGAPLVFDMDEYPKHGSTLEALAGLRAAFDKNGTVTAGNARASTRRRGRDHDVGEEAQELGPSRRSPPSAPILRRRRSQLMGMGPVPASQLCSRGGWSVATWI